MGGGMWVGIRWRKGQDEIVLDGIKNGVGEMFFRFFFYFLEIILFWVDIYILCFEEY